MNENVLLVEDEKALQMVLGDRLRGEGYHVDCASDAEAGFAKATSQPFDLMILDVMLPGRSGLDLCRDIRRSGLVMPVLMLSARSSTEDIDAGFRAGADAYVTKPFEMVELSARVEALLRRASVRRSDDTHDNSPPPTKTNWPAAAKSVTVPSQNPDSRQNPGQDDEPRHELDELLVEARNAHQLKEVIPRLRALLEAKNKAHTRPVTQPS